MYLSTLEIVENAVYMQYSKPFQHNLILSEKSKNNALIYTGNRFLLTLIPISNQLNPIITNSDH